MNGGIVQLSKSSSQIVIVNDNDDDHEEEDEDDEKVPLSEKESNSYKTGSLVLVRPDKDSKDRYWVGELLEDIERDQEKVKVWWWMSFHGKHIADNPDSGNWQKGYRWSSSGETESKTRTRTGKRKRKRKRTRNGNEAATRVAHIDQIWVNAVDIRVQFTSTFHLTATCLKKIHTRVNDWKIAARLEDVTGDVQDPNPGFDPEMNRFLQPPPASVQVDPKIVLTSTCSSPLLCIARQKSWQATDVVYVS